MSGDDGSAPLRLAVWVNTSCKVAPVWFLEDELHFPTTSELTLVYSVFLTSSGFYLRDKPGNTKLSYYVWFHLQYNLQLWPVWGNAGIWTCSLSLTSHRHWKPPPWSKCQRWKQRQRLEAVSREQLLSDVNENWTFSGSVFKGSCISLCLPSYWCQRGFIRSQCGFSLQTVSVFYVKRSWQQTISVFIYYSGSAVKRCCSVVLLFALLTPSLSILPIELHLS